MKKTMRNSLVGATIVAGAFGLGFGGAAVAGASTSAAVHRSTDVTTDHTEVEAKTSRVGVTLDKASTSKDATTPSTDKCKNTTNSSSAS
ncbi:MAG TPA: hypothetical protein VKR27_05880 [Acidimicrobiales bacterium]|nr:hypothetical protein [Acidimicrobiales bacterium]